MATLLVHIALLAYAAAAAAYLTWLVRPREWLVSAGRALLFAGLLLHLGSFAAAVSLSQGEGLARAGFGSDAWRGGQLFSLLAAATVAGYLALDVRYRLPAHFDDRLRIHTRIGELRGARFRFDYEVRRDGEAIADGWTSHACVDAETLQPVRIPENLAEAISRAERSS